MDDEISHFAQETLHQGLIDSKMRDFKLVEGN